MKKLISLVVLVSSISFGQNSPTKSILELKETYSHNHQMQTNFQFQESTIQDLTLEKKSPALAILYSVLLPGMGELYADRYGSGKYFTIADGALWGVLAGFSIYGSWQEKNYKTFAESKAGVTLSGKNSDYFANIGNYLSIDEYNAAMDLQNNFSKVYNTSTYYWKWDSNDQRREYRNMWSSSEQAFNNERFVVGALILNRVISAINAVRLVNSYNKNLSQQVSWNIYFNVENKPTLPSTMSLNFVSSF